MAKKYTLAEIEALYKDNFYVQHQAEMDKIDVTPSTPEIDEALIDVACDIMDKKYGRKFDALARAQYNHYCDVKASIKNGRVISTLSADERDLLIKAGIAI